VCKRLVIHQPNFLPYVGFFEQLNKADIYIAYDDVQFTKNEYQNRNFIKSDKGRTHLTLPVLQKGRFGQLIKDVELVDHNWKSKIMNKLDACYRQAPYFNEVMDHLFSKIDHNVKNMLDVNLPLIEMICKRLSIHVKIIKSSDIKIEYEDRIDRILNLMSYVDAKTLIAGTGTATYLDKSTLLKKGYNMEIHAFKPKAYPQLHGDFISHLSIIDQIFNMGWIL
jgi:hypothetical protein